MKNIKSIIYASLIAASILLLALLFTTTEEDNYRQPSESDTTTTTLATPSATTLIDTPVLYSDLFCYEFDSVESINDFLLDTGYAIDVLTEEYQTADKYTAEAITVMIKEIDRLTAEQTNATRQKEYLIKWAEKEEEYYYATRTWKFLKELGYSDVACAGILGNLMAECGGHTLKLDPFLYDKATGKYYGMFQWSTFYYPDVEGASFEEQLAYYEKTSVPVFKTFGKKYKEGFTLDDFNELTNPREAALAFAKVYERCASWTYERRQNFAEVAYQYFVLDFEEI